MVRPFHPLASVATASPRPATRLNLLTHHLEHVHTCVDIHIQRTRSQGQRMSNIDTGMDCLRW